MSGEVPDGSPDRAGSGTADWGAAAAPPVARWPGRYVGTAGHPISEVDPSQSQQDTR